ncbi:hypothetical protein CWN85_02190 [Vibrio splendidus]|uniref:hypothetical protein n=1 Tax=Vibrio splendidus TaxID=29497 RepID=UPI000D3364BD|nr:hypothetical protein [Vibrio splendidus]PTP10103.1 hypothetical protein CWN86_00190 [Vibrio splendidus]PTP26500.1 hypothetical protein CWN85_02190 [Vibrio splendidus]
MQVNSQNDPVNSANDKSSDRKVDDLKRSASELNGLWKDLAILQTHTQQWSQSTLELFLLEFRNSVDVFKKRLVFQLLFVALLPLFLFSIAVGAGVVIYYFTLNLLAGYGAFIFTLGLILICLVLRSSYLKQFIGFECTKEQLKEGLHVSTQKSTKTDSNEKT